MAGTRPQGRRRGLNRIGRSRADGRWVGFGKQRCDDITGWTFPLKFMVRTVCGNLVSKYLRDGSIDYSGGVWGPNRCEPPAKGRTLVSVVATVSAADTTGVPGRFTITRTGDLTAPMLVYYGVTGTAVPGIDYAPLLGSVQFAAGQATATVAVTPVVGAFSSEARTVTLTVAANPIQTYAIPLAVPVRPTNGRSTDLDAIPQVPTPYTPPNQADPSSSPCGWDAPATLSATATVTITGVATSVPILLRYEFESSPGFLVNSGTLGTGFNLSEGDICLG